MNKIILYFLIFSFLGWVWESIYCTTKDKKWANRGFLYGPICPIYGFGGIIGFAVFTMTEHNIIPELSLWMIFLAGFAVSMILEYPTSWFLEKLFHARWWDYSNIPMNINGRTSVPTSAAFGLAAILVIRVILPAVVAVLEVFSEWSINVAALVTVAVLSADITLTVSALTDFQKRVTAFDDAFQKHMSDAVFQLVNVHNKPYLKAVNRIAVFKLPTRKAEVARKIKESRFAELIRDHIEAAEMHEKYNPANHGETTTLEETHK